VRVIRRWNQTGQKWAGEPDISQTFFSNHRITLWILVCLTYLWNLQSLASYGFPRFSNIIAGAIATALTTAAVTFKLAFTSEDSPELMAGPAKSLSESELGVSLIFRARVAFAGIALVLTYTIMSGFSRPRRIESEQTFLDPYVSLICAQARCELFMIC
jgi:ethanolaminephosphotransferase